MVLNGGREEENFFSGLTINVYPLLYCAKIRNMKSIRYWVKTIILADLCCGLFAYKNGFASCLILCCLLRSEKQDKVPVSPVFYGYCCMDVFLSGIAGEFFWGWACCLIFLKGDKALPSGENWIPMHQSVFSHVPVAVSLFFPDSCFFSSM